MAFNFVQDGDYVNFFDGENLVRRLHNSSRSIAWMYDDTTPDRINFSVDMIPYMNIDKASIQFGGVALSTLAGFGTNVASYFPGYAGGGEGGGVESVTAGTNGGLLFAGTETNPTIALPYKVYTALLSRAGGGTPTAEVLGTPTINVSGFGTDGSPFYIISDDFVDNKTIAFLTPNAAFNGDVFIGSVQLLINEDGYPAKILYLQFYNSELASVLNFSKIPIEIRVYD